MLKVARSNQFKKDLKKIQKQHKDIRKLKFLINKIIHEEGLPIKYRNHKLIGNFKDCWECHIRPDWLLIYRYEKTMLYLSKPEAMVIFSNFILQNLLFL